MMIQFQSHTLVYLFGSHAVAVLDVHNVTALDNFTGLGSRDHTVSNNMIDHFSEDYHN